jgi:ribosome-binding factor A
VSQRTEKVAGEIREILGEMLVRGAIKDPRVRNADLITITYVRITGDLRQARVFFTVHGADDAGLEKVRAGLQSAAGFMRRQVGERLRLKATPGLDFEVDRVLDQEERIEELLRDVAKKE